MRRLPTALALALALLASACKPPVDAPEDLGEATLYLYENFDSETGEEIEAGLVTVEEYLLDTDLEGNLNDRSVTPPVLTEASFGDIDYPAGPDPQAQIPVAVSAIGDHALQDYIDLVAEENLVCIESNTTKYAMRTFLTDIDCFVDGSCDRVDTTQETRKESLIGKVWYDFNKDFRTLELEDGRTILIVRGWQPEVYETDGGDGSWDQSYTLNIWIPHPDDDGRTMRMAVMWSSITLSGVGDDMWASLVKSGLAEAGDNAENFIDGEMCGEDRDREYDRPQD